MNRTIVLALLLAGCVSKPVRKTVQMPPLLPPLPTKSVSLTKQKVVARPLPPTPVGLFLPASVTPTVDPLLGIYPFGVSHYLVVARQGAGCTLEMQWADTLGGNWNFLAGYGYTVEEQYVSAAIPADWLPYHRMFVKAINTQQSVPASFATVKGTPEIYTNHKLNIKGKVYRLIEISQPGTQFKMYKLVK